TWQRVTADGTEHSAGVRTYIDVRKGHWNDTVDGTVNTLVRLRRGRRVREYHYTVADPGRPDASLTVDRETWKEFDIGTAFRERRLIDAGRRRYREIDHQWHQWREFQNGRLVEACNIDGRVWRTDAFGRRRTMDVAKLP